MSPAIPLTEADLQHDLDRRRPGTWPPTQRREPDQVKLSPVFLKVLLLAPALAC
ncbi:hypothetical protein ACNKHM_21770 [Shigella sonnei]